MGLAFLGSFGILSTLFTIGMQPGATFWANPWLAVTAVAIVVTGIGAGILGLVAIVAKHDRSVLLFMTLVIAAWVVTLGVKIVSHSN